MAENLIHGIIQLGIDANFSQVKAMIGIIWFEKGFILEKHLNAVHIHLFTPSWSLVISNFTIIRSYFRIVRKPRQLSNKPFAQTPELIRSLKNPDNVVFSEEIF